MTTGNKDLQVPIAFSGPAQLLLYTRYGDPREPGWENKWITTWKVQQLHPWFPAEEIKIHKHFWPLLRDAFLELEKQGLHTEINSVHTCHEIGHLHDSPVLSVHSWAAALDMNREDNPMGSMGRWSDDFIKVMEQNGVYCGQNWRGIRDPAHFAMAEG
jgi:hypothetical protein